MKLREYQEELWHLKNDSMSMFEKRLLNGNITCIEPYFDGHAILQRSSHFIMARHGHYIERLIEANNEYVIAEIVRYGYAEEYYEDWANDSTYEVQAALLEKGLYVDILAKSKNGDVRYEVARRYPERTLAYIKSLEPNKQRNLGTTLLMLQTHPDRKAFVLEKQEPEVIKQFVNATVPVEEPGRYYDVICEYAKALDVESTPFEATMSPAQLFRLGNPRWMIGVKIGTIKRIKDTYKRMEGTDKCELFYDNFDDLLHVKTYWTAHEQIFGRKGKTNDT